MFCCCFFKPNDWLPSLALTPLWTSYWKLHWAVTKCRFNTFYLLNLSFLEIKYYNTYTISLWPLFVQSLLPLTLFTCPTFLAYFVSSHLPSILISFLVVLLSSLHCPSFSCLLLPLLYFICPSTFSFLLYFLVFCPYFSISLFLFFPFFFWNYKNFSSLS